MCLNPLFISTQKLPVPCGKCLECQINYSKQWAFRISNEASLYKENCFITLTYNEDNLPTASYLVKRDLQLFVKRLRDRVGYEKVRYFACGEYGSKNGRPHYHIIVFNFKPKDIYFFGFDKKHNKLYRSDLIESLWKKGFSSIGDLTFDSALYTAKYMQKFNSIKDKPKPFILQSRKPPIGVGYIKENHILTDKVYSNGKYIKLPRSYLIYLEKKGVDISKIKIKRNKTFLNDFSFDYDNPMSKKIALLNSKLTIDYQNDKCFDVYAYENFVNKKRDKFFSIFDKKFDVDLTPKEPFRLPSKSEEYSKYLKSIGYTIDFENIDFDSLADIYFQENFLENFSKKP